MKQCEECDPGKIPNSDRSDCGKNSHTSSMEYLSKKTNFHRSQRTDLFIIVVNKMWRACPFNFYESMLHLNRAQ